MFRGSQRYSEEVEDVLVLVELPSWLQGAGGRHPGVLHQHQQLPQLRAQLHLGGGEGEGEGEGGGTCSSLDSSLSKSAVSISDWGRGEDGSNRAEDSSLSPQ